MPLAEIVDGTITVRTEYHDKHLMQQLPGARYNRSQSVWMAHLSWATCVALRGLFGDKLQIGPQLTAWAWKIRNERIMPAMQLRDMLELPQGMTVPHLDEIEEHQRLRLYPYQQVDVKFLLLNRRALLTNPPGLGKTGVCIRFMQVLAKMGENPFPAVVICPNSLKFTTWRDEIAVWAPELTVQVVDGGAATRRKQLEQKADVYIINWESAKLHTKLAGYGTIELSQKDITPKELNHLNPRTVIMDEAHRLKDPRSQQTRAAWALAHQAEFRVAATGTPTADNVGDMWGLGHCVEELWFPAKTKFLDRYAEISLNFFGGAEVLGVKAENRAELYSIIDPIMRRVPKEAALPQLPPKLPVQIRYTPMTAKQQKAYSQMESSMIAMLNEILVAPNPLSQLTRLMQFASASAELERVTRRVTVKVPVRIDGAEVTDEEIELLEELDLDDAFNEAYITPYARDEDGKITTIRRVIEREEVVVRLSAPSAKIDDMVDLLEELGDDPLVVAAESRQLIELAAARLDKLKISYGLITGAQSAYERSLAVNSFQAGRIRVILMTLGAGAEGITLTRANTMLFMQEAWSEIKNIQAQDRVHRIGSEIHDFVRIIKQVTPGTVEQHKIEVLAEKRGRMEEIVRDEQTLLKLLGASVD